MRNHLFLILISIVFLTNTGCERNPQGLEATVNFSINENVNSQGLATQSLPSNFLCYFIITHQANDNDGSHCHPNNGDEVPMTAAFGPFAANQEALISLPLGEVTFRVVGVFNSPVTTLCQETSPLNFQALGAKRDVLGTQTVNLVGGDNTVSFTQLEPTGVKIGICENIKNINNQSI